MIITFKDKTLFGEADITNGASVDFFIRIQSFKAAAYFVQGHPHIARLAIAESAQDSYIQALGAAQLVIVNEGTTELVFIPFGNGFDAPAKSIETCKHELLTTLDRYFTATPSTKVIHIRLDYLFLITDTTSRKGLWMLNYLAEQPHTIVVYI